MRNGRGAQSLPLQGKVDFGENACVFAERRMRSFPSHFASHNAVYCGTDTLKMGVHIVIAEAKHLKTEAVKISGSRLIPGLLLRLIMLGAIDFNDELVPGSVKIDDIIAELLLPAELGGAGTEVVVPEMALLGRHFPAQLAGIGLVSAVVAESRHMSSFLV